MAEYNKHGDNCRCRFCPKPAPTPEAVERVVKAAEAILSLPHLNTARIREARNELSAALVAMREEET